MRSRHHDIAEDLRQQITAGNLQPGERLLSEAGLADRYKVSTVTLRKALAMLQGRASSRRSMARATSSADLTARPCTSVAGARWTRGLRPSRH